MRKTGGGRRNKGGGGSNKTTSIEKKSSPTANSVKKPESSTSINRVIGPKKPEPVLPPEPKPKPKPSPSVKQQKEEAVIVWRQLKLVYDHDIRLSQIPLNCSFKELKDTARKKFPACNSSLLIKYKDNDGDLVTITSTDELRLAESSVDKNDSVGLLKLTIIEVSPDQEPPLLEEEEEEEEEEQAEEKGKPLVVDCGGECVLDKIENIKECKEVEMDDWLFQFAQLFRSHIGINPNSHVDLHQFGMEFCSDALDETVTSEEAQGLFNKAALKFQEVAALALFNWGNVHMCAARKRVPLDDKDVEERFRDGYYDWVKEKYYLAREKYEQALVIKPDLYEGLLALGQQQFELAKLHWTYAVSEKIDLSKETIELFNGAEEKMQAAGDMWEKLERQRAREERKKEEKHGEQEVGGVMGSQIHLFWGNMLFERSQVEWKLGKGDWKKKLDAAVERFKLAGASEADVSIVLKKHCSNGNNAREAAEVKGSRTQNQSTRLK